MNHKYLLYPVLILILVLTTTKPVVAESREQGLIIVVTTSSLIPDIKQITCSSDTVEAIVPPGVDPHDYELKPSDIELLRKADVIISTAHTPFENKIRVLVEKGELDAVLVEIPYIDGIRILENPVTHKPNYHMVIYDPWNYKLFIREVERILASLNPSCSTEYRDKLGQVLEHVDNLIANAPRLNVKGLAVSPLAQYAVSWMGISVEYLIIREHGVPVDPQDLINIEEKARSGEIGIVVLVEGVSEAANSKALEIAKDNNIPYIIVPSPIKQESIPDKLSQIVDEITNLGMVENTGGSRGDNYLLYISALVLVLLAMVVALVVMKKH